jgi:hypothetical protein
MALTTSAILIQPTLDNVNTLITVEDLTDYVGNGINLATTQVDGYLRITLNSSTGTSIIYDNFGGATPDIDYNVSPISTSTINLPVDANGYAVQGTYTIEYNINVYLTATPNPPLYNLTKGFTYLLQQDEPVVCLAADVSCSSSSITSYDTTVYGTYSSVSRVHTLYPPPASGYPSIVGSQATLSSGSPIVDKTWTQEVQSTVTYTYPSGMIFIVYVEGVREIPVVCDFGMSKIYCCLKKVFDRYNTLQTRNITAADAMYEDTVKPMLEAMVMYNAALDAGNPNAAATYYDLTIQVSGCGEDCGCTGSVPQVVNPSAGAGNIVIVTSPDNSISVTPVVVGSTTTYEVQVSAAIQNALNALNNTIITTNTPARLDITSSTVGNTVTYNIDYISQTVNPYSIIVKRIRLDAKNINKTPPAPAYMDYYVEDVVAFGSNVGGSPTYSLGYTGNIPQAQATLVINNLVFVSAVPWVVDVNIMNKYNNTLPPYTPNPQSTYSLAAEVFYFNNNTNTVMIRLVNPITGQLYTLQDLHNNGFEDIYLNITAMAKF